MFDCSGYTYLEMNPIALHFYIYLTILYYLEITDSLNMNFKHFAEEFKSIGLFTILN